MVLYGKVQCCTVLCCSHLSTQFFFCYVALLIIYLSLHIFLSLPPFSFPLSLSLSPSLSLSLSHSIYLSQVREQLLDLKENVLETVVLEVRT
jgi:hypothetical protein